MRKFVLWMMVVGLTGLMIVSISYAAHPYVDAARTFSAITGVSAGTKSLPTLTPAPSPTVDRRAHARPSPTPIPTAAPIKSPKNRVNFLILASDTDSKLGPTDTTLTNSSVGVWTNTQVMIFVSFDPVHKQAYVISIPRDLWVAIPGFGNNKIDTASGTSDIAGAINTVESNFGVTIDHYAWVGLNGFIKIIDSIGGIDVNVIHPMVENDFPDDIQQPNHPFAYRRFFIPPGPQHLDGQTAELYVRARHSDKLSDFGRSQRQQQVLLLIKQKLLRLLEAGDYNLLPLIAADLGKEAKTDLHIPELLGLGHSLLGLKASQIHRWVLTNGYTTDNPVQPLASGGTTDALEPNWDRIRPLFACVDSDQAISGCAGL